MGNKDIKDNIAFGLIALFSIISFFTSYYGVTQFTGGFDKASKFELAFFAIIVFAIQSTLVYSLLEFTSSLKHTTKVISILVYLSVMIISVFFSYNFYYEVWRAKSYAKEVYEENINDIKNNINNYRISFHEIKASTVNLSRYSEKKAQEEDQRGGTCGVSSPGIGPINYLRKSESKLFLDISNDIKSLLNTVSADVSNLNNLLDSFSPSNDSIPEKQKELNSISDKIKNYINSENIINTKYTLTSHSGVRRNSLLTKNPKNNISRNIPCPDQEIDNRIKSVFNSINNLPKLEKIKLFNPNDDYELFTRSLNVFVKTPYILTGTQEKSGKLLEKMSIKDTYPLIAGMFIDMLILLVGMGIEYRKRGRYTGEFVTNKDAIILENYYREDSLGSRMLEDIRPYLHRTPFSKYIIIPKDQNNYSEELKKVQKVFTALNSLDVAKTYANNVPMHLLPRSIKIHFKKIFDHSNNHTPYFDIYKIKNRVWRDLILSYYEKEKNTGG